MEQHCINKLESWIAYEKEQLIGYSFKGGQQRLKEFNKALERVAQHSKFGRFNFLPKYVQADITKLKEEAERIMYLLLPEVKDCIFPQKKNNKLQEHHALLKDIFAKVKMIKENRFLDISILKQFEKYISDKKILSRGYLQSFKSNPNNFQQFHVFWSQAKILDSIQSDNDQPLFHDYFKYLAGHLEQEMKVLQQCAGNFPHFRYVLEYMIMKFKDFPDLNLEQQFLKPINHFLKVQRKLFPYIRHDFQFRHKLLNGLLELRGRISCYLSTNIGQLINFIAIKNLKDIRQALKIKIYPQEVLMKYKKMCKETYNSFRQIHPPIKMLSLNVLALIQKRQNDVCDMVATVGEREKILKEGPGPIKCGFNSLESKGQKPIDFFCGEAVLSSYGKDGKIVNHYIKNSQVTITPVDNKLPASTNDPFQGREVIEIEDDDQ